MDKGLLCLHGIVMWHFCWKCKLLLLVWLNETKNDQLMSKRRCDNSFSESCSEATWQFTPFCDERRVQVLQRTVRTICAGHTRLTRGWALIDKGCFCDWSSCFHSHLLFTVLNLLGNDARFGDVLISCRSNTHKYTQANRNCCRFAHGSVCYRQEVWVLSTHTHKNTHQCASSDQRLLRQLLCTSFLYNQSHQCFCIYFQQNNWSCWIDYRFSQPQPC